MSARLGFMLFFGGDKRKVQAVIKNVTTFSAEADVLKQGDSDVTATYIADQPDSVGNLLTSATIGGNASIPPGNYRYYLDGTYGGKLRTWYWDLLVLAKDLSQIDNYPKEDYDPFVDEVTIYEGNNLNLELTVPGLELSAGTGVLKLGDSDITSTYCNGSVTVSGDTASSHNIGAVTTIPAGVYGYFLSLTHSNSEAVTTYYWKINVLPKQSMI